MFSPYPIQTYMDVFICVMCILCISRILFVCIHRIPFNLHGCIVYICVMCILCISCILFVCIHRIPFNLHWCIHMCNVYPLYLTYSICIYPPYPIQPTWMYPMYPISMPNNGHAWTNLNTVGGRVLRGNVRGGDSTQLMINRGEICIEILV